MDEQRQLLFVNHFLPSNEQKLMDRLREAANRRITRPAEVTAALREVPIDSVADIVVGPSYIGVLFADGRVGRYPYVATSRPLAPSASPAKPPGAVSTSAAASAAVPPGGSGGAGGGAPGGSGGAGAPGGGGGAGSASSSAAAHNSLIARTAKFRRVMLASSSGRRGDHRSVIIDRARPMLPAASVPEDLIAQAQVVLQGKSREVIVRELQRTNLNVNEAVNNLLSRDDDDDEGSEGGAAEMCIPEELLSLLDSTHGSGASLLDSDLYGGDTFEYLLSSRERKNRAEKEKEKQKSTKPVIESNSDTEQIRRYEIPTGSILEPWEGLDNKEVVQCGPPRFTRIACTQSELLAICSDNKLYGWDWSQEKGDASPHPMFARLGLADDEVITLIAACALRVAVVTSAGRMATWLDTVACGQRLSEALFVPPQKLGDLGVENVAVSNTLALATTPHNVFYWCGIYPVAERRRIFEKARTKQRKHVSFDVSQIVEGTEVRTKSGPIYSIGCIAAHLGGPVPMIGILMENVWSLSEVCRFRLIDPAAYDADRTEQQQAAASVAAAAAAGEDDAVAAASESREAAVGQQALTSGNRKRAATDEVFPVAETTKQREEAWPVSEVVFIHEEAQNDTAIVKIVDGGYCAVEYVGGGGGGGAAAAAATEGAEPVSYATVASRSLAQNGDKEKPPPKMRLIRKDELTVVSHKVKYARSPVALRVEPFRFVLSGSTATKRVLSAVADSQGFRALVERRGVASIVRVSVCGRTLSAHALPLYAPALHAARGQGEQMSEEEARARGPSLHNYGDDAILMLRDGHGGIIPLVRDAAAGFKEPSYLQLPAASVSALAVKSIKDKDRPSFAQKANREAVMLSLLGTHPRTLDRRLPSLLYAVMCCDERAVRAILDALHKEEDLELSKREIVDARSDGARNVLATAVMNACATKNSLEADVETPLNALTTSESRTSAEQARANLDKKWNDLLKSRSTTRASGSSIAIAGPSDPSAAAAAEPAAVDVDFSAIGEPLLQAQAAVGAVVVKMELDDEDSELPLLVSPSPVENPRQRQEGAIAIVKALVTHPSTMPFLSELLGSRDIQGQTPFMAAVNHRAYSAARFIFEAIKSLFVNSPGEKASLMAERLGPYIFPSGARPDESPLFVLAYNDTCSYTWTGDEHINQDIFECRTDGLTGSLCCCTECAFTCHRSHECRLKRTSPTAYCDCWEKGCCKALVSGNQFARESLLMSMIKSSNLYKQLNGRGEHILLYLARKLSRQGSEQYNYRNKARRVQPPATGSAVNSSRPEHDLDPPKFARTALLFCLRSWNVVRSLAMVGVRHMDHETPMAEELFHLHAQHGSSHLDKFMLILMTKCSDETTVVFETLFKVLSDAHNRARATGQNQHLEEVNFVISRFVRSVARLFILAVIISNAAAGTAVSGIIPCKDAVSVLDRPSIRGISLSGIFGHLTRKDSSKDSKQKNMGTFIVRCKVFFEHFALFAIHEMAQLADAALAPVRTGMLRPCVALAAVLGTNADSLENLERYINTEPDMAQLAHGCGRSSSDSQQQQHLQQSHDGGYYDHREERRGEAKKRRKRSSRRDTDREDAPSESRGGGGGAAASSQAATERDTSDSDSDSDSDGDGPSSRRLASQSSALAANEEPSSATHNHHHADPLSRRSLVTDDDYSTDGDDEEESESNSDRDRREDEEDEEEEEEDEDLEREEADTELDAEGYPIGGDVTSSRPLVIRPSTEAERAEARARARARMHREQREQEEEEDDEELSSAREPSSASWRRPVLEILDHSSEGSRSNSSPDYSSTEEADEERRNNRIARRRRRAEAAAAAATAAPAAPPASGGAAAAAGAPPAAAAPAAAADEESGRYQLLAVDLLDDQEQHGAQSGGEREGSARTRPDDPRRLYPAAGSAAAAGGAAAGAAAAAAASAAADDLFDLSTSSAAAEAAEVSAAAASSLQAAASPAAPAAAPTAAAAPSRIIMARRQQAAASGSSSSPYATSSRSAANAAAAAAAAAAATAVAAGGRAPRLAPGASPAANTTASSAAGVSVVRSVVGDESSSWREDRLGTRRNATADASRAERVRPSAADIYRRPPLPPWITRGGDLERRTARGNTSSGTTATTTATSSAADEKKSGADAASAKDKDDEMATATKAAIQLATAFSFAVRVIGELLPMVAGGENSATADPSTLTQLNSRMMPFRDIEQLAEIDERVRRRAMDHVRGRLEDSWRWLAVVLDHVEAQIKYINAVAATDEARRRESKERRKSQRRGKSPQAAASAASPPLTTSPQASSKARRDTMACLLGVLRSHTGEAGDDTPLVDLENLRAPALVVDAYLGYVEAAAEAEKAFEEAKSREPQLIAEISAPIEKDGGAEGEMLGVRRFYQRSNSVSFPGASFTDAHDTLTQSCLATLPLVERPQLLTTTVEKEMIFGPSTATQEKTRAEHDKVIRAHGAAHAHNQSLTAAPMPAHALFVDGGEADAARRREEEMKEAERLIFLEPQLELISRLEAAEKEVEELKKSRSPTKGKRGKKRGRAGETKQQAAAVAAAADVSMEEDGQLQQLQVAAEETVQPPPGFERVTYEEILETFNVFREHPLRKLMGRWRFTLQLIARELHADLADTLGGEAGGSRLLAELAGFDMKQHELRARMEKYRATATKDLSIEVRRDPAVLVRETCYQLNRAYSRRMTQRGAEGRSASSSGCGLMNSKRDEPLPPLATHKVKVRFTDEPGEGSGVARSYYTALAEALVSLKQFPFSDYGYQPGNEDYLYGGPMPASTPSSSGSASTTILQQGGRRIQLIRGRDAFYATVTSSPSSAAARRRPYDRRNSLTFMRPPYVPADMVAAEALNLSPDALLELREEQFRLPSGAPPDRLPTEITDRIYMLVRVHHPAPAACARLTGMFLDLPLTHALQAIQDPQTLKSYINDAIDLMVTHAAPSDVALLRGGPNGIGANGVPAPPAVAAAAPAAPVVAAAPPPAAPAVNVSEESPSCSSSLGGVVVIPAPPVALTPVDPDDAPLFFRPSKKAHYSPVPGRLSPARIAAFRNVGRMMGVCLSQCEMFPLRLSRHVLKYILGRPLNWHDFAFYDPQMFESLRKLIVEGCSADDHAQFFDDLQMTFCTQLPPEATGVPPVTIELVPGGSEVLVTRDNVVEYVYRLVETRLLGPENSRCLAAIKQGVQDVLPQSMLDNLTAEDLRLVLCGTEMVSLSLMQSYTAWSDESHSAPETITKYKQWFWQVAERLTPAEKQDLIFFWTGAPSLPSTEEGFQPLPTIVVRPSDDGFLPTANTCISRLYLPLYASKKTLAAKLALAIKAKNFGFV